MILSVVRLTYCYLSWNLKNMCLHLRNFIQNTGCVKAYFLSVEILRYEIAFEDTKVSR